MTAEAGEEFSATHRLGLLTLQMEAWEDLAGRWGWNWAGGKEEA